MNRPRVCTLLTDGINCEKETGYAFEKAGGQSQLVHINQLRNRSVSLMDFDILAIPGGFSYGDDIAAGVVLGNELMSFLRDQLLAFVEAKRLVLGICNGFQVLVRTGLLTPSNASLQSPRIALVANDCGKFVCRWVSMTVCQESLCVFTQGIDNIPFEAPAAHAEGKLVADEPTLQWITDHHLAPLRYCEADGNNTMRYPANPNGSRLSIAGVCNDKGTVFGMMPHPEANIEPHHYFNWRRRPQNSRPHGLKIFENAIRYART
ncbi:MAG: phosphoribosylformylglycinamidine synthase I [bacterium]|nr:phosphoribosylformylglycinamidine synthase I [bacterium]